MASDQLLGLRATLRRLRAARDVPGLIGRATLEDLAVENFLLWAERVERELLDHRHRSSDVD